MSLRAAFLDQAGHCEALGSDFMGQLLRLLAENWPEDTKVAAKFRQFNGDIGPSGASLPLRLAAGLHALVLSGQDTDLAALYPPHTVSNAALWHGVNHALHHHDDFLDDWTNSAPQTNEVRRSVALIPVAHLLADRFNLPLTLSELGASGGLNLMFDQFALKADETTYGPTDPALTLSPVWSGPTPPVSDLAIRSRRGVDLNPVNAKTDQGALRLLSYLWPDQPDRIQRTRAAIAAQNATVDQADAIDWLSQRLTRPHDGSTHLIYHTIAWQYFPQAAQQRGNMLIEQAGARATADAPLAWFGLEFDGQGDGAAMTLRLWPGDHRLSLGRADFHGRWVRWLQATH